MSENDIFGDEPEEELPAEEPSEDLPLAAEAEEPVAEPEAEQPEKVVPMNALNEARMNERQARQELNQVKSQLEQLSTLKAEMDEWRKSQQSASQQQDEERFNTDPLGTLRDDIRETKQVIQGQTEAQMQQQEAQKVIMQAGALAKEFAEATPDYGDAYNHYVDTRRQELSVYGLSEAEIAQAFDNEMYALSQQAISQGRNPAEIIYNVAKTRGYAQKIASEGTPSKIKNLDKGQKASQSLANTQGESETVGLQDISKMSDEDFDKFWDEMERENRQ